MRICECLIILLIAAQRHAITCANHDLLDQLSLIEELPTALSLSPLSSTFEIVSSYYEDLMREARELGIYHATPSRLHAIGKQLCVDANRLFGTTQSADQNTHYMWSNWMSELSRHETTESDCMQFHRYFLLDWEPKLFHWPLMAQTTSKLLQSMIDYNDTEWDTHWVHPIVSGVNYAANAGIPSLSFHKSIPGIAYSSTSNRVQNVFHMFTIYHATHGQVTMGSLQLVVEFGGGYGDLAAMAREMGFRGTHVIYDLLPALLLQQYFHRTSNWPSYLLMPSEIDQKGQEPMQDRQKCISSISNCHLNNSPLDGDDTNDCCHDHGDELATVLAGKTVMIPASTPHAMMTGVRRTARASSSIPVTQSLSLHAHPTNTPIHFHLISCTDTLFLATWSLTETPWVTRYDTMQVVLHELQPSVIFLAFSPLNDVERIRLFQWLQTAHGMERHHTCCWLFTNDPANRSYYFIAQRRQEVDDSDKGADKSNARPLSCVAALGCNEHTLQWGC